MFNSWNNCSYTNNNSNCSSNKQILGCCGCNMECKTCNRPKCKTLRVCSWEDDNEQSYMC